MDWCWDCPLELPSSSPFDSSLLPLSHSLSLSRARATSLKFLWTKGKGKGNEDRDSRLFFHTYATHSRDLGMRRRKKKMEEEEEEMFSSLWSETSMALRFSLLPVGIQRENALTIGQLIKLTTFFITSHHTNHNFHYFFILNKISNSSTKKWVEYISVKLTFL